MHLAGLEPRASADAVTDGFKDNGIDAIHYSSKDKTLYLVQSKWDHEGRGSFKHGDALKVTKGLTDLMNGKYVKFNDKVRAKKAELDTFLLMPTREWRAGGHLFRPRLPRGLEVKQEFDELLTRMNDSGDDILRLHVLRQSVVHGIIASGARGTPLNLEVGLHNWGLTTEPFKSYYGQVAASEIAQWDIHHPRLFAPNLRMFLGSTEVNQSLMESLRSSPEKFWYCNNGITALCASIKKKRIGGEQRDAGVFECMDVTIVNGAQTVGAIATTHANHPQAVAKAMVQVRFISLENCPDGFSSAVTRATNTQNRIERRDFVTLDEEQERIRIELKLDGITYVYKSGEKLPSLEAGFELTEATVALACSHADLALAVQAKREIGKLWEDITKEPYKKIFSPSVSSAHVWRMVQILSSSFAFLEGAN